MAWQAASIANLHEFATASSSYIADNTDYFCSYNWQVGVTTPSTYPDLTAPPSDAIAAAAAQAVDILRRRAARPDMPVIPSWMPMSFYPHLPLADYLGAALPLRFSVSPGDKNRVLWYNDIAGFDQGVYNPISPDPSDPVNHRWPYSSSYRIPLAFFTPDAVTATTGTIVPGGSTAFFMATGTFNVGTRRLTEVGFPSHKVYVFDSAQWEGAKYPVYFAYSFARIPMLMVDGSAHVRVTNQANTGFQANNPRALFPTTLPYSAQPFEPPALQGSSSLTMYYLWTRGGIQGRDFEGPELDTSNWF